MADTVTRFNNRVDDYKKFRPSYPSEILEPIQSIGLTSDSIVADVGSGTGIFTQILLKSGCQVFAVEPNDVFRESSELNLSKYPNFKSVNGTGENTTLNSDSIDIITVAQAFHWFDVEKTRKEFARILKKGDPSSKCTKGYAVLLWNDRDDSFPLQEEYSKLLTEFCPEYEKVNHRAKVNESTFSQFFKNNYSTWIGKNVQEFDFEGFLGRFFSASYAPTRESANYGKVVEALKKIFDTYQENGKVLFQYQTLMYYGQLSLE